MSRSSSQSQGICYSNLIVLSIFPCSFLCQRSDYLYTSLACEALFLTTTVDIFKPFIDVSILFLFEECRHGYEESLGIIQSLH